MGNLDADGFLFLTGRSKELIKRGGEQVSPYEVEEILIAHPAVEVAVVFGVCREFWGEEVAAVVVLKPGLSEMDTSFSELTQFASDAGLNDAKIPRQIVIFLTTESLPKTGTGKYRRAEFCFHLGLVAVDLSAAAQLQNQDVPETQEAHGKVHVKPDKAIHGIRFFISVMVIFYHIGKFPRAISVWRSFIPSMSAFFILAGFSFRASQNGPIRDVWNFYRGRIIAAHPLYLLPIIYMLLLFFLVCPPARNNESIVLGSFEGFGEVTLNYTQSFEGPGSSGDCLAGMHQGSSGRYAVYIIETLLVLIFAQLAWPWGLKFQMGTWFKSPLWFSSAYYFCILLFPLFYFLGAKMASIPCWSPRSFYRKPALLVLCWVLVTVATWELGKLLMMLAGVTIAKDLSEPWSGWLDGQQAMQNQIPYCFPPIWAARFFLGMITYDLFEMNRGTKGSHTWQHWGKVVDCLTALMLLVFPLTSLLQWKAPNSLQLFAKLYSWSLGGGMNLSAGILLLWIYGLATGQGYVAKLARKKIIVHYLGPAAYSMFLLHYPTAYYWIMLFHGSVTHESPTDFAHLIHNALDEGLPVSGVEDFLNPVQFFISWWEWPLLLLVVISLALL